jgi:hypothetical protein
MGVEYAKGGGAIFLGHSPLWGADSWIPGYQVGNLGYCITTFKTFNTLSTMLTRLVG